MDRVAADLRSLGADAMVLKGPPLQRRLLHTPAAYPSLDLDILVRGASPRRLREGLAPAGWSFAPVNGRLWRLDGAAAFEGHGAQVDVHWGLHLGLIPAPRLRPLERAMWSSAERSERGWFQPGRTPLATYLLLHGADRPPHAGKRALLLAALDGVDRGEVLELAAASRLRPAAEAALVRLDAGAQAAVDVLGLSYRKPVAAAIRALRVTAPRKLGLSSPS